MEYNRRIPCRNWVQNGSCPFGVRCHFSHDFPEPFHSQTSSQVCRSWSVRGSCKFGDQCFFKWSHTNQNLPSPHIGPPTIKSSSPITSKVTTSSSPPPVSTSIPLTTSTTTTSITSNVNNSPPSFQNNYQLPDFSDDEDIFGEGEDDEYEIDLDDLPSGYNPHSVYSEGSSCEVQGCDGILNPKFSSTGQLMFYQCQKCEALFTNYPET